MTRLVRDIEAPLRAEIERLTRELDHAQKIVAGLPDALELRAERDSLQAALRRIACFVEREYREGESAYQLAILARDVLNEQSASLKQEE